MRSCGFKSHLPQFAGMLKSFRIKAFQHFFCPLMVKMGHRRDFMKENTDL